MRQRHGRLDLQKLLHVPAADRLGAERPPILTPLALYDARQRAQPLRQELRRRQNHAMLTGEVREQRHVGIGHQQIMFREGSNVPIDALAEEGA